MLTETDLKPLDMDFEIMVNAVDEKDETLSVQDLAMLEPFFLSSIIDPPADVEETRKSLPPAGYSNDKRLAEEVA